MEWCGGSRRPSRQQTAAVSRSVQRGHTVRARLASKQIGQRDRNMAFIPSFYYPARRDQMRAKIPRMVVLPSQQTVCKLPLPRPITVAARRLPFTMALCDSPSTTSPVTSPASACLPARPRVCRFRPWATRCTLHAARCSLLSARCLTSDVLAPSDAAGAYTRARLRLRLHLHLPSWSW